MNKKELRQSVKNKKLSDKYIHDASELIQQKIIDSEEFKSSKKIFCYISVKEKYQQPGSFLKL